jgi:glutamate synthase domain-containing protein 2
VTLIVTGGLRVPEDFAKAMAMGADGIATQKPELRALLDTDAGAKRLASFFGASVKLMQVLARACGHRDLSAFASSDLTTWKKTWRI